MRDALIGISMTLVGALGLAAIFVGTQPVQKTNLLDVANASVQLENYCSGTVIEDPDLSDGEQLTVITAKHCMGKEDVIGKVLHIHSASVIGSEYQIGEAVPVIIKDISKTSDLVLLQGMKPSTDPKLPKMKVYGGTPAFGSLSYAFGYPRGESLTVSLGMLGYEINASGFPELSTSGWWQKSTNAVQGGSSGGGLFVETDSGFELVGVLTWGYKGDEGASYWSPVQEVRQFLEENNGQSPS